MNKQVRFTTALALGAAVLSIPALAIAQPTVDIVDPARLVARGAGAIVSVTFTCDATAPTDQTSLSVNLTQRVGNSTTNGSGFANGFNCTATPQTIEVVVTSFNGRFKKSGSAIAQAFLSACHPDFFFCESAQAAEEIQIRR